MAGIGSWWVKGFGARPGEEVAAGFYTNYLRADGRPLGGKLYVTNERILFCPHLIDGFLGGSRRMIPLADVTAVERFDPEAPERTEQIDAPGGGTEERVRLQLSTGQDAFFIVNDLDRTISEIEDAIAARPGDSDETRPPGE